MAASNTETIIGYYVVRPAEVELHIYDIAGQRVRQLREGVRGAGSYRTCWDGRDDDGRSVSSGIYLYRITENRRSARSGGAAAAAQDAAAQIGVPKVISLWRTGPSRPFLPGSQMNPKSVSEYSDTLPAPNESRK